MQKALPTISITTRQSGDRHPRPQPSSASVQCWRGEGGDKDNDSLELFLYFVKLPKIPRNVFQSAKHSAKPECVSRLGDSMSKDSCRQRNGYPAEGGGIGCHP